MQGHPGGISHTQQMLALAGLVPPAKILDMGAGNGESVTYLRTLGYEAEGIDLAPRTGSSYIIRGNFLYPPYNKETFDAILSQCSFYVSGDVSWAFSSAYYLLKPNGILMISDVCPRETSLVHFAKVTGFSILYHEDQTPAWKTYYIEALWRGTADCFPTHKKMNYELLICQK